MEIICLGLSPIERDNQLWKKLGYGAFPFFVVPDINSLRCSSKLIDQQTAVVTRVRGFVCGNSQATKRLHLTVIELAACALGVRVTKLREQRKSVKWERRNHRATMKHLVLKLENARKTAASLQIRLRGKADYESARDQWQQYLAWMRRHFAYAFLRRPKGPSSGRNTIRNLVAKDWVKWVQQMLNNLGLSAIPEAEIMRQVREGLYAARRAGIGYGGLSLPKPRAEVEWFIEELTKRIFEPAWERKVSRAQETCSGAEAGFTIGEETDENEKEGDT
jgi:hypothetical protein